MYKVSNDLSAPFVNDMMAALCIWYNTRSTTEVEKTIKETIIVSKNLSTSFE